MTDGAPRWSVGTRVRLLLDLPGRDDRLVRAGAIARVEASDGDDIVLLTASGRTVDAPADAVEPVHREEPAPDDWDTLRDTVVLDVIVGSQAWGLAGPDSDEDHRGVFVLPLSRLGGLDPAPTALRSPDATAQHTEVGTFIGQALRADPNALETLFSPHIAHATREGRWLREAREAFVSARLHATFSRYALGQLHRMQRKLAQHATEQHLLRVFAADPDLTEGALVDRLTRDGLGDASTIRGRLRDVARSAYDRGWTADRSVDALRVVLRQGEPTLPPYRPKNAYNLLRILHMANRWLRTGAPMIAVDDPGLRARLLTIKAGEADLDDVLAEAEAVAAEADAALPRTPLPATPDTDAARRLLDRIRTRTARVHLGLPTLPDPLPRRPTAPAPEPLPDLRAAAASVLAVAGADAVVLCALSGAHLYGFPSPDSDLDLKGIRLAGLAAALAGPSPPRSIEWTGLVDGVEHDVTLVEVSHALTLLERGNGNLLEQCAAPGVVVAPDTDRADAWRYWALHGVHRGVARHYTGFFDHARAEALARPSIKAWLYALRVGFTGVHALRTGEIVPHLPTLAASSPHADLVATLIAAKRAGPEHAGVAHAASLSADLSRALDGLGEALADAAPAPQLPAAFPHSAALRDAIAAWRTGDR